VNMQDIKVSDLNKSLAKVSGTPSETWNSDPYGTIFVQHDDKFTRVAYVTQSSINDHKQTQLKIVTYDKDNAPAYVSSDQPDKSYKNLANADGSANEEGTSAVRNQTVLLRGAKTALNNDPDAARAMLNAASAISHRTE
jgi:hypothetical protein